MPSTKICPDVGNNKPKTKFTNVVFPVPVFPTIPRWLPFNISRFILLNTISSLDEYLKDTLTKTNLLSKIIFLFPKLFKLLFFN